MELFYVEGAQLSGNQIVIKGPEARHICRVMRHRVGDRVLATDGRGTEYELELREVGPDRATGVVLDRRLSPREPRHRVALAQGVLKGDHMAQVVHEATQLGVAEIVPLLTGRVVAGAGKARLTRLRRVSVEAMKVSTRTVAPCIAEVVPLERLPEVMSRHRLTLVAYEGEQSRGLEDVLTGGPESVLVVVGPEGGFEEREVALLETAGARTFGLGPRRLRAELAAAVAVANVMHRLGDLGGKSRERHEERRCY